MLTEKQMTNMKKRLEEREHELIRHFKDQFGLKYEFSKEVVGELSNYDNHPGDQGTELFERSKDLALNEHAEKELEAINESLHAIDEGTYGICKDCGEDIPYERLLAVPTTDRCVEHASKEGFERERPVEESVMTPNFQPEEDQNDEEAAYDREDAWQEVSRYGSSDGPSDLYGDHDDYDEMYPNSKENRSGSENVENYISSDEHGKYDEHTLDLYRNQKSDR
jgi:YteA family regulatory protein